MALPRVFVSRRDRTNALLWLAALALASVVAYLAVRRYAPFLADPQALRAWIEQFGVWAPVAFVAVQALQVVFAPIPAQVFVLLGGFLFGAVAGTAYSLLGAAIGSTVAFWLSRRYGRRYVERVVTPDALQRFDAVADDHALASIFLIFLIPGFPDDVLCFVAGLTDVRLWQLLVVSLVGRVPSYVFVNFIGAELARENFAVAILLSLVLVAVAAVPYYYRSRLFDLLPG